MNTNILDTDLWKNTAIILGIVVSTYSVSLSGLEYSRQGTLKRADYFFELGKRFKQDNNLMEICSLCEVDDPALKIKPYNKRASLLSFFEEIAISMDSKLIKKEVVHYMFGYYIIKCWESENFWFDLDRDGFYWTLFSRFAKEMKENETKKNKYTKLRL